MTKLQIVNQELANAGLAYSANCIICWHRRPLAKLQALLSLTDAGHDVRHAQFAVDRIVVDGLVRDLASL